MSDSEEEERGRRERRSASSSSGKKPREGRKLRTFTSDQLRKSNAHDDDGENERGTSNVNSHRDIGSASSKHEGNADKVQAMRARIRKKERQVALHEPEVHVIGEIDGGINFGSGVCCRWQLDFGSAWEPLSGNVEGQTHVDYPSDGDSAVWSHPLDVHFLAKGIQGWPRLLVQVWQMDEFGRVHLRGYGFTHLPCASGSYELDVATWRPMGTLKEEIAANFLGVTPQLRDMDLLFKKAWSDRCRLSTTSAGIVRVNVDILLRNFHLYNVNA
ncbi:B9 domain-containing protein 2 [Hondaea fermentalgiana]|uniref:B9 domain-containing protein 2 n=1 Tax=Hondaea fermentalgiana TaxID=2315210 RepID=A0A2R5G8Y1_9STRA|nr:B9 domain-containing protein 2 [Hondaea fermentalgiana]|eukprot:GBG27460.1 B9 domain-containing protein 2 [Hondaea fermentalgiana]